MTLEPAHSEGSQSAWRGRLCALLIAAVTLAVYGRLCTYDFTNWDDNATVWENKHLLPPTASSLWHMYRHEAETAHIFTPVTWTFWWLLATACARPISSGKFALDPHVYHSANVALHAITSVLLFFLLRRLLRARSDVRSDLRSDLAACGGALLFALHPVQVETVGWISGAKDLLAGLFMVIAMLQYVGYATSPSPRRRVLHYVLTVIASIAAMLSKPSAVALPLILAAIDGLLLRRSIVQIARGVLPLFMVTAPVLLWSKATQTGQGLPTLVSPLLRPLVATDALAFYLGKVLLPLRLTVDYGRYPRFAIDNGQAWFTWIAPLMLAFFAWLLRRRLPELLVCAAIFAAALLPVLGLVPFDFQQYSTVADHYLYVAMIGVGLTVGSLLTRIPKVASSAVVALLAVGLGIASFNQTRSWRDSFTLFGRAIAMNGRSWLGYNNLAEAWAQHDRYDLVEHYARESIRINPQNFPAHMNLGVALLKQHDLAGATAEFESAVRLQPANSEAHTNLATAYAQADRIDEAIHHFQLALSLDPNNSIARPWLKVALQYRDDLRRKAATRATATTQSR
jgi:Flp pilus assembly protein TadD